MKKTILLLVFVLAIACCLVACDFGNSSSKTTKSATKSEVTELITDSLTKSLGSEVIYDETADVLSVTVDETTTSFNPNTLESSLSQLIFYADKEMTKEITGAMELEDGENTVYVSAKKGKLTVICSLVIVKPVTETEGLIFELQDDGTYVVTGYEGDDKKVVIPASHLGKTVTAIGDGAFEDQFIITSIALPDTLKTIGDYAFCSCEGLTTVTIPDSVEKIGKGVFASCYKLVHILNNSSVDIDKLNILFLFDDYWEEYGATKEEAIVAFDEEAYTELGVNLDFFEVVKKESDYKYVYSNDNGIITYAYKNKKMLLGYTGKNTVLNLSQSDITDVCYYAFYANEAITSVVLPETVKKIHHFAFSGSTLETINLPNSLTYIGYGAFYGCRALDCVTIGANVGYIGFGSFDDCTFETLRFGGTMAQWESAYEDMGSTPSFDVQCSDGTIAKPVKKTQLSTPVPTIDNNGVVSWSRVPNAGGYMIALFDSNGDMIDVFPIQERSYQLEAGQSLQVRAHPNDVERFIESEWSDFVTRSYSPIAGFLDMLADIASVFLVFEDVTEEDTVSMDLDLGLSYTGRGVSNDISLLAKANLNTSDAEFMTDVQLNDEKYLSLGYKDGFLYIREPLNMLKGDRSANAYKIDMSAFKDVLSERFFSSLIDIFLSGNENEDSESNESGDSFLTTLLSDPTMLSLISNLFTYNVTENSKSIGVTAETISGGLGLLSNLGMDEELSEIDKYFDAFNIILAAIGLEPLTINGEPLSYNGLRNLISNYGNAKNAQLIKIECLYDDGELKRINFILDFSQLNADDFDYTICFTIGFNTLSTKTRVSIETDEFTAQDLEIDLGAILAQKGIEADIKAVVHLSDAFATRDNKWVTITADVNGEQSVAYLDATGIYVDFTGLFTALGLNPDNYQTKFKELITDEFGEPINMIDKIIEEITAEPDYADEDEYEYDEEEYDYDDSADPASIFEALLYLIMNPEEFKQMLFSNVLSALYPEDDILYDYGEISESYFLARVFGYELDEKGSTLGDYVLFYNDAMTIAELLDNIGSIAAEHEEIVESVVIEGEQSIGIIVLSEESDLTDYVSYFFLIPGVDENDQIDYTQPVALNDNDNLKALLDYALPLDSEERAVIEGALGITLYDIIDNGLYAEFGIDDRDAFYIHFMQSNDEKDAEEYFFGSVWVGMKIAEGNQIEDIINGTYCTAINPETEEYYFFETIQALYDAFIDYQIISDK